MCMLYSRIETLYFNVWIPLFRKETHIKNTCILWSHSQNWSLLWTIKNLILILIITYKWLVGDIHHTSQSHRSLRSHAPSLKLIVHHAHFHDCTLSRCLIALTNKMFSSFFVRLYAPQHPTSFPYLMSHLPIAPPWFPFDMTMLTICQTHYIWCSGSRIHSRILT